MVELRQESQSNKAKNLGQNKSDMAELRQELKAEIQELRAEFKLTWQSRQEVKIRDTPIRN